MLSGMIVGTLKKVLINTFYGVAKTTVRVYVDKEFFDRVEGYVQTLVGEDYSGAEKFAMVEGWIKDEWEDVSTVFISAVADAVLLRLDHG